MARILSPTEEDLLAGVAHELRLPVSHIKGFVTSLLRTDVEWDVEARSGILAEIDLETDRLAELVNVLLASCAPDGTADPSTGLAWTQPQALVQGALHRLRVELGSRQLHLDLAPGLPSVPQQSGEIERALANLIENAVKYSPPDTPIGVRTRMTDNDELEFVVEDEGPGVPDADRERIFQAFFRAHAAQQSNIAGHGLGLAISSCIVARHGGRIFVTDRPGGGACFHVVLTIPARRN